MLRDFEVERSRAFANATGCVVMRAVTWTVVAAIVARVCDRDAAKVRTHAEYHEPRWINDSLTVGLWIAERGHIHGLFSSNFVRASMAYEKRLSSPLEYDVLPFWDLTQIHFNLGQREHILGRRHGASNRSDDHFCTDSSRRTSRSSDQIGEGASLVGRLSTGFRGIPRGIASVSGEIGNLDVGVCISKLANAWK